MVRLTVVWNLSSRVWGGLGCVLFGLLIGPVAGPAYVAAAPLAEDVGLVGQAISQRFLPSGASIVMSAGGRACVVSRRIGIEASVYTATDGTVVPFETIRRSIAASVQAVQAPDEDQPGFRIQLKFSPAPGTPILLTIGGQVQDVQAALEPSTDSVWISGQTAAALQAAFAAGERPVLQSTSADTAHLVTDRLDAPDLAALAACQTELAQPVPQRDAVPLTNEIRVTFTADPATTPLATLPDLRTCGMTDAPGELYLARLETVTGFFAQTDKVFVSFAPDGALAQVYIPGIFDGDFRAGANRAGISQAADSNVPMIGNAVKGCLGARTVPICQYSLTNGERLLAACLDSSSQSLGPLDPELLTWNDATPVTGPDPFGGRIPNNGPPGRIIAGFTPDPPGGGGGGGGGGGLTPPDGGPGPDPDPGPSPVPLPAPILLLLGALAGLAGIRRLQRRAVSV